jgi:hypothetical protein
MYVNINTQALTEKLPSWIAATQTSNPTLDMCAKDGWRKCADVPKVKEGYERLAPVKWKQSATEPMLADPVVTDTLIADRIAAEAKAKADADKAKADFDKAQADALKARDDMLAALTFKAFTDPKQQAELNALVAVVAKLVRHEL